MATIQTFDLVIPVLDEEETLEEKALEALFFAQSNLQSKVCIKIADNGSQDRTEEIAVLLAEENPNIEYIKVGVRGVGLALRTAWGASDADIVGYMDLDLATDLKHLIEVEENLLSGNYDIVNGSRLAKGARVINRKPIREVTSRGFNMLVRGLLGVKLTDGMCGFKFLKGNLAHEMLEKGLNTNGWFFSTELLVKSTWLGKRIKELPVTWTDDGTSKVNIKKLSMEYFKEILRLRKEKTAFIKKHGNA